VKPRRVLLTGGSGQVGRALRPRLEALVDPAGGAVLAPGRDGFDLARPESLGPAIEAMRPDLVVSCGAYTAVDRAESEPDLAERINAAAPAAIARGCATVGAALVHCSTDYVFSGDPAAVPGDAGGPRPWRPDDPTGPRSVYGRTKLAGEEAVRAAAAPALVLRLCWIYDAEGRNFLRTMLRLAAERDELRVVDDQAAAPTFAGDVAAWMATIIESALARDATGRWHFGDRAGTWHLAAAGHGTWCDFARAIVGAADLPSPPVVTPITTADFPTAARRPAWSVLDCSATDAAFGLERRDWREAVPEVVRAAF